jgi:hypothetical protein
LIKTCSISLLICLIKLQYEAIIKFIGMQGINGMETVEESLKSELMIFFGEVYTDEEWEEFTEAKIELILDEWEYHGNRKAALGYRVQVLRVLVMEFHKDKSKDMDHIEFNHRCEKYLDNLLKKYDYRLEKDIDHLRKVRSTWNVVGIL